MDDENQELLEETQHDKKMRRSIDLFRNYRQSFFDEIPKDPLLQNENVEQVINNFYQIHNRDTQPENNKSTLPQPNLNDLEIN